MITEEEYLYLQALDENSTFKSVTGVPANDPRLEMNSEVIDGFKVSLGVLMEYRGSESHIVIPDYVQSIDEFAFDDECSSVTSIYVPNTVTSISRGAFEGCPNLEEVRLPEGLSTIETCTFSDCTALRSVNIPDSVRTIGECAFSGCTSLSSIAIPDGVTKIENAAFFGCSSLTKFTLPSSLESIGKYVFKDCPELANGDGYVEIGHIIYDYFGDSPVQRIPGDVVRMDDDIYDDIDLTSLHCQVRQIPDFSTELSHLAARTYLVTKDEYSSEESKAWNEYIDQEKESILKECVERDDDRALRGLTDTVDFTEKFINGAIENISSSSQTSIMAILLDYRNRHFLTGGLGLGELDSLKL